jgi:hypothetical protein
MTPEIWPVSQRLIVDFDDVIVSVSLNTLALGGVDRNQARDLGR